MNEYGPVVLKRSEKTGLYVVWSPLLGLFSRGIWSQGRTEKEALTSIDDGITMYLKFMSARSGLPKN